MTDKAAEARRAYKRQWAKANPEKVKACKRKWARENPEKIRAQQARYWARKAAAADQQPAAHAAG